MAGEKGYGSRERERGSVAVAVSSSSGMSATGAGSSSSFSYNNTSADILLYASQLSGDLLPDPAENVMDEVIRRRSVSDMNRVRFTAGLLPLQQHLTD